jgi:amino acid permease
VFTPLLASAGVPDKFNSRTTNILVVTITALLPLSLLKDLSSLAKTSILGFLSIVYTVVFMIVRATDGSYALPTATTEAGRFLVDNVVNKPSFLKESVSNVDFTSLVLASNLGLAYIAHYNGPVYYREMKDKTKFKRMVYISFGILTAIYAAAMAAGYSTFGDVSEGNIMLNYHPSDILSSLGRVATGFSILFGFPLAFCGIREGIYGVAENRGWTSISNPKNFNTLVASMLTIVTLISCTVKDVSLVVGVTGAAMGAMIVYILPAIMYTRSVALKHGKESPEYKWSTPNLLMVPFGMAIAVLGVGMTISEALNK